MIKLFFLFAFIFMALCPVSYAQDEAVIDEAPVRGFIWQLPPQIIKEYETGRYVGEEQTDDNQSTMFFFDKIRDIPTSIGYEFDHNKLWRVKIFIEKFYINQSDRLEDLMIIQADLTKRFGPPMKEEMIWLKDREKDYPASWGWAVHRGELIMASVWQKEDTQVTTYLGAKQKSKPEMSVTYEYIPAKVDKQGAE